jgi:hypothetical protein
VSIIKTRNKDMECIIGVMGGSMMEDGRMECSMAKDCFMILMGMQRKGYGRMARDLNGLKLSNLYYESVN